MKKPIFVRPLSDDERKTLKADLRSPDAFVLRRCQILLASADGCTAYQIARTFGCHDQTVRNERGVHLGGDDAPYGEALGPCLRVFRQFLSEGE